MSEWLREGIEGRSLKAALRLYLLGLMVLAPAAALLALAFGSQPSFVATPLLVFVVVAVEYAICYRARLRKDLEALLWKVRLPIGRQLSEIRGGSAGSVYLGTQRESSVDLPKEVNTFESIGHEMLHDRDLAATGDRRAVDRLVNALRDKDPVVRYWAALALGEIDDPRAVDKSDGEPLKSENVSTPIEPVRKRA